MSPPCAVSCRVLPIALVESAVLGHASLAACRFQVPAGSPVNKTQDLQQLVTECLQQFTECLQQLFTECFGRDALALMP